MKNKLSEIVPNNPYSYNVSFDENIGSVGRDIMKYLKETNKLQVSHSWKGIDYRFAFGTSGNDCLGYLNNNMDSVSWDMFFTKIVLALELNDLNLNEIKFETLKPNHHLDDVHLRKSRWGDIKPTKPYDYGDDFEIFYSQTYHTDKTFALNNYKILVYLNDINEDEGGLIIANPIISPKRVKDKCVLFEDKSTVNANEILEKEIVGKMGTIASFNSHILHRANLPKSGWRDCLHFSFQMPGEQYFHEKYSNNHFRG
tara:strand:+ start:717 stop:1484 length:768 start_codon:yes stop_codon:yes gene_type:complete